MRNTIAKSRLVFDRGFRVTFMVLLRSCITLDADTKKYQREQEIQTMNLEV